MTCSASGNRVKTVENRALRAFTVTSGGSYNLGQADVAQLVEQSIRNRQVIGSSPIVGSSNFFCFHQVPSVAGGLCFLARLPSSYGHKPLRNMRIAPSIRGIDQDFVHHASIFMVQDVAVIAEGSGDVGISKFPCGTGVATTSISD